MRKLALFSASLAVLATVAMVSPVLAAPVVTVTAAATPTKTVNNVAVGSAYILSVSDSTGAAVTAVDFQSGSNGLFASLFQVWEDTSSPTPTASSITSADTHLLTGNTLSIVLPDEDNNVMNAPAGVGNAMDYGYGTFLKGAPAYNSALSQNVALLDLRTAPTSGLVAITTAQINAGTATLVLTATGILATVGQLPEAFSQQFGVVTTSTPEPASLAMLGLGAVTFLRRRRA